MNPPLAAFPKGSAQGLIAAAMLTGLVPFFILQALTPVLPDGMETWLSSIIPSMLAPGLLVGVMLFGIFKGRKNWYRAFAFAHGCLVLLAYAFGALLGIALFAGVIPDRDPSLSFMHPVNLVCWLVIAWLPWLLWRMLRMRFWQPWTTPDQWEQPAAVGAPSTRHRGRVC